MNKSDCNIFVIHLLIEQLKSINTMGVVIHSKITEVYTAILIKPLKIFSHTRIIDLAVEMDISQKM